MGGWNYSRFDKRERRWIKHSLLVWTTKNRKRCISCSSNSSSRLPSGHPRDSPTKERRTSMTETIRFDGISLPVSDIERSIAFYQQFGFEVQVQHGNFALLRLGEGTIGLLKMDLSKWPNAPRGAIHIELSTENLDALYEQLQAEAGTFRQPSC